MTQRTDVTSGSRLILAGLLLASLLSVAPAGAADPAPVSQIIGPGEGRTFGGGGGTNRVLADLAPGAPRDFMIIEARVPAGYVTPWPLHFHMNFDEFSYILEGTAVTDMGDGTQRQVSPGSVTYASRTHPHRFSVPGTQPVRQLSVATAEQGATFKDAWRFADDPEKLKDYLATTGTFFVEDKVRQKAAGAEPAKTGSSIVPPGAGRRFEASGAKYRMLADVPAGATRSFAIMDAVYPAGYASWPLYTSCRFDEFWYVMEGTILVDVGGEQKAVTAGTAVYSPRGTPHHFSVPASGSARLFAVVSGGQLAVIEGAGKVGKDPAKLRAYLAKSQIHPADQTGACQS